MWEFCVGVAETLLDLLSFAAQRDFWIQVAEIIVGIFSFTMLTALTEWYRTIKKLKKYVKKYRAPLRIGELPEDIV